MKVGTVIAFTAVMAVSFFSTPTYAQKAPLPLGSINPRKVVAMPTCPAGYLPGMSCFHGTVEKCSGTDSLGFSFGVADPQSYISGTIVFHDGGGGTTPYSEPEYGVKYLAAHYRVIFLAWDSDWEDTSNDPLGVSIKDAACRPATLFHYLYQNYYTEGGMCAQGFSAGSGALGYSLAWYGSASYLDNVELLSGPVFSDIDAGCRVPNPPAVTVCATGQYGCSGAEWPDPPSYVRGEQELVGPWSGWNSCNEGKPTSALAQSAWKAMSIVDGTSNPSFIYPKTAMAGWLCSNVNTVQNNSAAEGNFFYLQFTNSSQAAQFSVTRIDHCHGVEGVTRGETPEGEGGFDAISDNMIVGCVKRH